MASSFPSWVRPPQYAASFAPLSLCNRSVPLHCINTNYLGNLCLNSIFYPELVSPVWAVFVFFGMHNDSSPRPSVVLKFALRLQRHIPKRSFSLCEQGAGARLGTRSQSRELQSSAVSLSLKLQSDFRARKKHRMIIYKEYEQWQSKKVNMVLK